VHYCACEVGGPNLPGMSQPGPETQDSAAPSEPRGGSAPAMNGTPGAGDGAGAAPEGMLRFLRRNRLGPAAVLGVLWTFTPAICGIMLFWKMETVSEWLRGWGEGGAVVYAGLFVVLAGLGMLPTVSQAVLGGWCFGFAAGYPAALVGFTGASLIGYIVARTVAHGRVEQAIQTNPKARAMREALIGHGFWKTLGLVTLLRLPPNSPFALTNFAMSTTGVPVLAYVLGTMLGMAPRTAVAVMVGTNVQQLTQESIKAAGHPTIMIGVSLALFLVIGWIGKRTWDRVTGPRAGGGSAGSAGAAGASA
jgi:uncharacterized membrane protein YdjX (TVP38/TMEM64 family)